MGVFNTTRQFALPKDQIASVASDVLEALRAKGYEAEGKALLDGGWDLSVTKGGMFKAVLGLQTALKISLAPRGPGHMLAEASVGIFGQQAIPTILALFVAWPVMIPQIWGIIQQSKLDDTVMTLIADAIQRRCPEGAGGAATAQCAKCGGALSEGAKFCTECGEKIGTA